MDASGATHSDLLELAAADDLPAFRRAVEIDSLPLDAPALWYGRWGSSMSYELRTPLMVAALYGSASVVRYILASASAADGNGNVNVACGSDNATALHCCAAGGAAASPEVATLLVSASADARRADAAGRRPADMLPRNPAARRLRAAVDAALRGGPPPEEPQAEERERRKEYPVDATLPDINSGVYGSDEFRMYWFKVKPCSRAYTHDWTECPYAHPGENARRRDPRKHQYSCVPCPEFRKSGACRRGDSCEYAHGVFESWLHPQQYRTRLCKDEVGCARRVCFFAHKPEELRAPAPCPYDAASSSPPSPACNSPRTNPNPNPSSSPPLPPLDLAAAAAILLQQQQAAFEEELLAHLKPRKQSPPKQQLLTSALLNSSRASAFAKRSLSFVDRGGIAAPPREVPGWGSPRGKADWGIGGDELSKLRRSVSFGMRGEAPPHPAIAEEEEFPDVSWVQSLVGDGKVRNGGYVGGGGGGGGLGASWGDHRQLYLDQGRIFA